MPCKKWWTSLLGKHNVLKQVYIQYGIDKN